MTTDDLLVISPLDQDIDLQDDDNHILERVEAMIDDAANGGDGLKALSICKQVVRFQKLAGIMLARVLYRVKVNWDKFGIEDDFYDVLTASTGLHKSTIFNRIETWEMYAKSLVPEPYVERLMDMNIKSQTPIAKTLSAGYDISDDDWEDLANANDFSTVNAKLREIKGKEPRSNALMIFVERDGTIQAIKDNEMHYVGWLQMDSENEVVQKAMQRIISATGILVK